MKNLSEEILVPNRSKLCHWHKWWTAHEVIVFDTPLRITIKRANWIQRMVLWDLKRDHHENH